MIIGIDARAFLMQHASGVEITACNLIKAVINRDSVNIYWLYSPEPLPLDLKLNERVKNVVVPGTRLWTQRHLRRAIKTNPPDIFWSPSNILPICPAKTKCVATIHDLAWHILRKNYSFKDRFYSLLTVKRAIRQADRLIAVSQQTKRDLKKYFGVPGENIEVIYHALRDEFSGDEVDIKTEFPALDKYVLFVGRIEDRKNLCNLIKAWSKFHSSHPEIKLVLVGWSANNRYYQSLKNLIKKLNLNDNVMFLNYVNQKYLAGLYGHALGLAFPSKYEGFGMPILEAFASNIPVLTSNIGATAEIAGDAAILVNPYDIDNMAKGLIELVDDSIFRSSLINKGRARLKCFNWDNSAQKLIELWTKL